MKPVSVTAIGEALSYLLQKMGVVSPELFQNRLAPLSRPDYPAHYQVCIIDRLRVPRLGVVYGAVA